MEYMDDYANGKGYYGLGVYGDNKIASMNAGLNVGLFYKDISSCGSSCDTRRTLCQDIRELAMNELTELIKQEQAETGIIEIEERISHARIKRELENAAVMAEK